MIKFKQLVDAGMDLAGMDLADTTIIASPFSRWYPGPAAGLCGLPAYRTVQFE